MHGQTLAQRLAGIDLFTGADAATRDTLARRARAFSVAAGTNIIDQDDVGGDVFALFQGRVRVTLLSPRGQEVSFRDQSSGTTFGLLGAIDGKPRSANVVAIEPSALAAFNAEALKAAMVTSPAVMDAVLQHLAFLVRGLSDRVFEFTTLVARNRVHAELLRLAREGVVEPDGTCAIRPAPTHAVIATRISTQRETVSRELAALQRMGLVAKRSGALIVRDVDALAALVESAQVGDE